MDLTRLYAILRETTAEYRKGASVVHEPGVTHHYFMPHVTEAPAGTRVDCHFMVVGVDLDKALAMKAEVLALLNDYPQPERLAGGPSYIEVGGEIGDQGMALRLFALGQVLGLWTVITPATLGITGAEADELAGRGLVMTTGLKRGLMR